MKSGAVLDLGTGPGTQAIELSKLGFNVTATDVSKSAIKEAKKLTKDINFFVDDILDTKIKNKIDLILDRGCFHTIEPSSSRRRHTRLVSDWSSDVCSSDLCRLLLRSEEHTSELQSLTNLVCRLLL